MTELQILILQFFASALMSIEYFFKKDLIMKLEKIIKVKLFHINSSFNQEYLSSIEQHQKTKKENLLKTIMYIILNFLIIKCTFYSISDEVANINVNIFFVMFFLFCMVTILIMINLLKYFDYHVKKINSFLAKIMIKYLLFVKKGIIGAFGILLLFESFLGRLLNIYSENFTISPEILNLIDKSLFFFSMLFILFMLQILFEYKYTNKKS